VILGVDTNHRRVPHNIPYTPDRTVNIVALVEEAEAVTVRDTSDNVESVALKPVAHIKALP
jgi:hypothetical protein